MDDARFLLIRHGESIWNAAARWQGQGDPPLSERGRHQVAALAGELADEGIELIVASDLTRAVETASILGEDLGLPVRCDPRLRELDIGTWTGCTRQEIEARDGAALRRFESGEPGARAGGGESRCELARRVRTAAQEIARAAAGRCVAVVAHLGVIRALCPGRELPNAGWCRASAREIAAAAESAA